MAVGQELLAGLGLRRRDPKETVISDEKASRELELTIDEKKEKLNELSEKAMDLAKKLRAREDPEAVVEHTWFTRKKRLFTGIDRVAKIKDTHTMICARGWLLARTASIMDKQPIVQEVLLGVDGKIYAYATDSQRYIESLLKGPKSRKQIQDAGQDLMPPFHTQLSNLPLSSGIRYDENTNPRPKNIYVVDSSTYPLPGVGKGGHIYAEPDVLERGLTELAREKTID